MPRGWVRLKVACAGLCGSDVHNYVTGQWQSKIPVTPGHELCGWITELGEEVAGLKIGDLVVADSRVSCGQCPQCLSGHDNRCATLGFLGEVQDGGFAQQLCISSHRLLRVPATLPPTIAVLSEPLAVALRVVRRLDPEPDRPIVIAGGGCIGGLTALLLSEFGFGPLYLVERNQKRAALLRQTCDIRPISLEADSFASHFGSNGPAFMVEATGSSAVLGQLIDRAAAGTRIVLVGLFKQAAAAPLNRLVEREIELRGCSVFTDEQNDIIPLLDRLAPRLAQLAAEPIALDALPAAYERLIQGGESWLKILVVP